MYVFEITIPGTWLVDRDRDWTFRIQNLLHSLESQFFEANAALNLFIYAQATPRFSATRDTWEVDSRRRCEIRQAVQEERGAAAIWDDQEGMLLEAEIRFKREQWASGRVPREFEHNRPFIYARAFLYALDAFDKFLGVLAKEPNVPPEIAEFHTQIAEAFPHLRGVRNTAQHLEDRARGLGTGRPPKPLDLKPVESNLVHAPGGGVLVLNSLNGSKYGSTMADGHYGEVDVAPASLEHLQRILERVLQSFEWKGPPRHAPSV